jgi:hypothetical protein
MNCFNRLNASNRVSWLSYIESNLFTMSVPFKVIMKNRVGPFRLDNTLQYIQNGTACSASISSSVSRPVLILRISFSRSKSDGQPCVPLGCNRQRGRRAGTFKVELPADAVTVLPRRVGRSPSHSNSPRGPHLESIGMCSPSSSESCGLRMRRSKNDSDRQ